MQSKMQSTMQSSANGGTEFNSCNRGFHVNKHSNEFYTNGYHGNGLTSKVPRVNSFNEPGAATNGFPICGDDTASSEFQTDAHHENSVCNGSSDHSNGSDASAMNGFPVRGDHYNGIALKKYQNAGQQSNGVCNGSSSQDLSNARDASDAFTTPLKGKPGPEEGTYKISRESSFSFLESLFEMLMKDGLIEAMDRKNKVCEFKHPDELKTIFPDIGIDAQPTTANKLLDVSRDIIKYSTKTAHPRFFNQLFGGMDQYSLGGAYITETLNASMYTYEVSPVFTLMEKEVFGKMLRMIGFNDGDAIFTPGGSISNLYAMNVARFAKHPETKTKGLCCLDKPLCLFTSEKCHYSLTKAAFTLGFGTDALIDVAADEDGKMMPSALEERILQAINEGFEPFFVNATAGTTVLGAYDPLDEIADICQKYGLWMHVDGAWGGGALLTTKYRHLLRGVEKADSMTWNPHKLMGTPQQCATFLCKHKGVLKECHSANASYLFQQDKGYDMSYDTGDMSLQCGRKVDVLKLWMQWKGKGDLGMARDVQHLFDLSRYLAQKVKETEGFRLLIEPQCTNVCFWYIPPRLRGHQESDEWWQELAKVAPVVKDRMMQRGSMMTGYQPDGNNVNFFRMVLSNFDTTYEDMDFVVEEIDRCGRDL